MRRLASAYWYTNIDHYKCKKTLKTPYLFSKRDVLYPDLYLKIDKYDAISVNKVSEIPMDYDGIMGLQNVLQMELNDLNELLFQKRLQFKRGIFMKYNIK